jgi:superfamily II DNA/RNA helicase
VSPTATPQALIISPTRELTIQIYNLAKKLTKGSMVKPAVLYYYKHNQADELGEGCNILDATLGRLLEYVDKDLVSLSNIKVMVLDEADLLLHRRNWPKIDRCVENMPRKRSVNWCHYYLLIFWF